MDINGGSSHDGPDSRKDNATAAEQRAG